MAWLAEYGQSLEAGEVILSGALTKAMEIAENHTFRARFGGLGSVKGRFVA